MLVKPLEMVGFQKKFHKQLAELVFMHHDDCFYGKCTTSGTTIENEEEEEEMVMDKTAVVQPNAINDFPLKCPTLFALLGGKKEVAA